MAFRFACETNDLEYAQWLHKTYHFTIQEIRADDDLIMVNTWKKARKTGKFESALWLTETFFFT